MTRPTTYGDDELRGLLQAWKRPGGVLSPEQLRALLAWDETGDDDRGALEASLAATRQDVEPTPLAPQQRRGHVSRLDRIRGFLGRLRARL